MHTRSYRWLVGFGLILLAGCVADQEAGSHSALRMSLIATPLDRSAAELENDTWEHLAWAKAYRARIASFEGTRSVDNTLVPYNELLAHVDAALNECRLFAHVHPNPRVRLAGREGERAVESYLSELTLDSPLHDALTAVDLSGADAETHRFVNTELKRFIHVDVDRPADVRNRIAELRKDLADRELRLAVNTDDRGGAIVFDSAEQLGGLPRDWIARHSRSGSDEVRVTTRRGDYLAIMAYADDADARRRLYEVDHSRGCPQNDDLVLQILHLRHELATVLGYSNWAAWALQYTMVGQLTDPQAFIDAAAEACRPAAHREREQLLTRKRLDVPDATDVKAWDVEYYRRKIVTEELGLECSAVPDYFDLPNVLYGQFRLAERLFGLTSERAHGLNLWNQDVTAWNVRDGNTLIGRIYVDPYDRASKQGSATFFGYRTGAVGVSVPQAVLVLRFPKTPQADEVAGLVLLDAYASLARGFGDALYWLLAGHGQWIGTSGIAAEPDFARAPGRVWEELSFQPDSLLVVTQRRSGRAMPAELAQKIHAAYKFGRGLQTAMAVFQAALWLDAHTMRPEDLDLANLWGEVQQLYGAVSVGQAHGHSCVSWLGCDHATPFRSLASQVIAAGLLDRFEKGGALNEDTASDYRRAILVPGRSRDGNASIQAFLDRPLTVDAFEARLQDDPGRPSDHN